MSEFGVLFLVWLLQISFSLFKVTSSLGGLDDGRWHSVAYSRRGMELRYIYRVEQKKWS